jgi:hypothetical protein
MTRNCTGLPTPFQESASDTPARPPRHLTCTKARTGTTPRQTNCRKIQHFTPDLEARLDKHLRGQGARITQVLKERGIGWDVVAVWPGNRQVENALKLHSATRICPACTPSPRIPRIVQQVIEAEEQRRAREAERLAGQVARAARARSPYQQGAKLAEQFIADQAAAGRTARQIAATHAYLTGPGRQRAHATPAQAEVFRGYSEMVTAALARLREDPAARREPAARTRMQVGEAGRPGAGPRWRHRRVAAREDGLPQNADGSLSRSRTTDTEKLTAGVMTRAQQAEHTALRRGVYGRTDPQTRDRIQRLAAAEASQRTDPWATPTPQARPGRQRELEPEAG